MKHLLIALVRAYRLLLSPWLGSACRFEPTCSRYAIEALERHGALRGSGLAGWRLLRCHPWCAGGFDPVPDNAPAPRRSCEEEPGLFTRLVEPPSAPPPADAARARALTPEPTSPAP